MAWTWTFGQRLVASLLSIAILVALPTTVAAQPECDPPGGDGCGGAGAPADDLPDAGVSRTAMAALGALALGGMAAWTWRLWAGWLGLFTALFTRMRADEALSHPTRRALQELVRQNPGVHLNEIFRRANFSPSIIRYHLAVLVRSGQLVVAKRFGLTCYHLSHAPDRQMSAILPALRSEGARRVLEAVLDAPRAALVELAETAGLQISTAHYHGRRLEEAGLVRRIVHGRRLVHEPTELARLPAVREALVRPKQAAEEEDEGVEPSNP